jgi:coenzyme F420-reducing hydrogenase beta subunit
VIHTFVEKEEDLYIFRNSKYVQSKIGNAFSQVKSFLLQNKIVCFSGTPCQVEGLFRYLRKDYENLVLIDVVCRAIPSPKVWNKYLEMQKEKYGNDITNLKFRDKSCYGYKYSQMSLYKQNKIYYHQGVESDMMLRAFFSNICDRPSCYNCSFKKRYRVSDFTLWDCFEPEAFCVGMDDDKGTTSVLIQSAKGISIFDQIKDSFNYVGVNPERLTSKAKEMLHSVPANPKRAAFFEDLNNMQTNELVKKYFSFTYKTRIEKFARLLSYKLGIYKPMKKIFKLIFKNIGINRMK